jgi:hypothetical protein
MYRMSLLGAAASISLALAASPAFAHAMLRKAEPAVGGVVAASPKQIRLKFSEGVEPRFSSIALATQAGAPVPTGKPALDPGDASALIAAVPQPLKPGVYRVTWRAVSVDTHKTQGAFTFTVAP